MSSSSTSFCCHRQGLTSRIALNSFGGKAFSFKDEHWSMKRFFWSGIFQYCWFSLHRLPIILGLVPLQSKDSNAAVAEGISNFMFTSFTSQSIPRCPCFIWKLGYELTLKYMCTQCTFINRRAIVFIWTHRRKVCSLGVIDKLSVLTSAWNQSLVFAKFCLKQGWPDQLGCT